MRPRAVTPLPLIDLEGRVAPQLLARIAVT
jgi:hypothetical protein